MGKFVCTFLSEQYSYDEVENMSELDKNCIDFLNNFFTKMHAYMGGNCTYANLKDKDKDKKRIEIKSTWIEAISYRLRALSNMLKTIKIDFYDEKNALIASWQGDKLTSVEDIKKDLREIAIAQSKSRLNFLTPPTPVYETTIKSTLRNGAG